MPKRTIILITVLTVLTAILVFLAIKNEQKRQSPESQDTPVVVNQKPEKTALLVFSPTEVVLSGSQAASVEISIDTKQYKVDGVQLDLLYDPEVLTNVQLTVPQQNFFGGPGDVNNFINEVDAQRGRVTYYLGISPTLTSKQGKGVIAELSFTRNPSTDATESAIEILDKSMIVEEKSHESVLATPSPLHIIIGR